MATGKVKVTLNIDEDVIKKSEKVLQDKNIPRSRIVESFLNYVGDPHLYCFSCGEKFYVSKAQVCPKCSFVKCTKCSNCSCKLTEQTSSAVFFMRKVYEDLIGGRVK